VLADHPTPVESSNTLIPYRDIMQTPCPDDLQNIGKLKMGAEESAVPSGSSNHVHVMRIQRDWRFSSAWNAAMSQFDNIVTAGAQIPIRRLKKSATH
jgi:hypothetical protein